MNKETIRELRERADGMITADTVVRCPECGATFRVGKALV